MIAVVQQQAQPLSFSAQVIQFLPQAFLFQARQSTQWHRQNRIRLPLTHLKANHQAGPCRGCIPCFLDHADHGLKVVQGCDQAFHHFQAVFGFAQGVAGPPDQRQFPVVQEGLQQLAQ